MSKLDLFEVDRSFGVIPDWNVDGRPKPAQRSPGLGLAPTVAIPTAPRICVTFNPTDTGDKKLSDVAVRSEQPVLLAREIQLGRMESRLIPVTGGDWQAFEELFRTPRNYWYVRFKNGREVITLSTPLVFYPSAAWEPGENRSRKPPSARLATRTQRERGAVYISHWRHDPLPDDAAVKEVGIPPAQKGVIQMGPRYREFNPAARRFEHVIVLSYKCVSQLKPGDKIVFPNLQRVYDPLFEGLRTDSKGNNAISNLWNISIPLYWPEDWSLPALKDILFLRHWRRAYWETMVRGLEGEIVHQLREFAPAPDGAGVYLPRHTPARRPRGKRQSIGQCYHGEHEECIPYGLYFVYVVRRNGKAIFLLDSPCPGVALRAYRELNDAFGYAAGGSLREAVESKAGALLFRIIHDSGKAWEALVEKLLDRELGPKQD